MVSTLDDHAVSICERDCRSYGVARLSALWHQRDGLNLGAFLDRADHSSAGAVAEDAGANFGEGLPPTRHTAEASPVQGSVTPKELNRWPVLPGYEILAELGRGGMGIVYRARQLSLERIVAVEVLDQGMPGDGGLVARFHHEKLLAARLTHPNLVTAYDAGQSSGLEYLVMELVEGVGLDRLLEQRGSFPIAEACEAVRQAALGLQHLHEQGLVHREGDVHLSCPPSCSNPWAFRRLPSAPFPAVLGPAAPAHTPGDGENGRGGDGSTRRAAATPSP